MESPKNPKDLKIPVPGSRSRNVGTAGEATSNTNLDVPVSASMFQPAGSLPSISLINPTPLPQISFPDRPAGGSALLPATIPNVRHLLVKYGITVRYDEIKKKMIILVPGHAGAPDNADEVAMTHIYSLANLNALSTNQLNNFVCAIGDGNRINRVVDWIMSKPWDGVDRLPAFYDTLEHREDFPVQLKETLMRRWMISAVAAVMTPRGFTARGVLTIQGPQSIGKTTWIKNLVSDAFLREEFVKLDHHLDGANKDSLLTAVSHWIVEIGELDSSFKKDIARLKGFLTAGQDKIRRPYGRTDSEYPRRTVFCATVNDTNFLVDPTGNSRWWTIPVTSINYAHGIDMQQLFAQLAEAFHSGEPWWLTQAEESALEAVNAKHRVISAIGERVLDALDLERTGSPGLPAMTPTELLDQLGIRNPSNMQCKDCATVLRTHLGESKRIKGREKWRIPFKQENWSSTLESNNDDKY